MDIQKLQDVFGSHPAKLYVYDGPVTDGNEVEIITHQFVEDASTNLVSCIVSFVQGMWVLHTEESHSLGDKFRLLAEFPLPIPEEPEQETPEQGQ